MIALYSESIREGAVACLRSIIGLAALAICNWVLYAKSIGVDEPTIASATELAMRLEMWCLQHAPRRLE